MAELIAQAGVGLVAAGIGAWATLAATTRASRHAFETALAAEMEERRAERRAAREVALRALAVELRLNLGAAPGLHAWHAHGLFELTAFERAMPHLASLRIATATSLERAHFCIRRYNAAASYSNERVGVGSGAADESVTAMREEARTAIEQAASDLEQELEGDRDGE